MSTDRCPQCQGVIRPGADWCGLCFADLRPAPPAPPPLPAPEPRPEHQLSNDPPSSLDLLDPLTAPLGVLSGSAAAGDVGTAPAGPSPAPPPAPPPAPATGWPCVECGARNDFELSACVSCGTPFGAGLRDTTLTPPGTRQSRLIIAGAAVGAVLAVIALLTFFTGSVPEKDEIIESPPVPIEEPAASPDG